MIILICSDIHANYAALEAIVAHAGGQTFDAIWFLGDVVGYGPSPGLCVARLRELVAPGCWLLGNHDALALDMFRGSAFLSPTDHESFSHDGQAAISALPALCAADQPAGDSLDRMLDTLTEVTALIATPAAGITIAHGSVYEPLSRYGTGARGCNAFAASDELAHTGTLDQRCLVLGHSHFPCLFFADQNQPRQARPEPIRSARWMSLPAEGRAIINPGSVGQPRDNNPQASYALLDLERWRVKFMRVPYPAADTAQLIIARGLPRTLAARLEKGE